MIAISLKREGDNVLLTVRDNGIGMSDDVKTRIFEKFYQGDTSHTARGNGIGLNIVQRVVTLARGAITVESREGEGSCFTVTLPL